MFDPHNVAVFGHSLGGSTATLASKYNPLVIGGINFDGPLFGTLLEEGLKNKPFVLVASTRNKTKNFPIIPYWGEFYQKSKGAKLEVAVWDTQHYAFLDVPLLLTVDPLPAASKAEVDKFIGTLGGDEIEKADNEIMSGLLELLFENKTETLKGLSGDPNIDVILSHLPKGE